MADPKIKFKRSAVAGKIPTAAQVPLGEIALNTNDGILYASKDVGAGTTVIAVNPFRVGTGTDSYNAYFTAGNVGIASTQPTGKLDVIGQVNIKGTTTTTPGTSHAYDPNYLDESHGGSGSVTLSNNNKTFTTTSAWDGATATAVIPTSGKYYWEYHFGNAQILFTISSSQSMGAWASANSGTYGFRIISKTIVNSSETFVNAIATAWNNYSSTTNKTIGVAYDADNGTMALYFGSTLVHTISSIPTNTTYYIHTSTENANQGITIAFDSSDWNQSAPSGFSSLNTPATTTTSNNHLNVSGITTTSILKVGTGITASGGIVTATSFSGSGASLTNISASSLTGSPTIEVTSITASGTVGIGSTLPSGKLDVAGSVNIKDGTTTSTTTTGGVVFDGSDDILHSNQADSDFTLGSNDFTVEYFIKFDTVGSSAGNAAALILSQLGSISYAPSFGTFDSGSFVFKYSGTGSGWRSNKSLGTVTTGVWYHIAIVRSGNTFYTFQNGVQQATWTESNAVHQPSSGVILGRRANSIHQSALDGTISNVRVVVGTALYTSGFTTPTAELTNVSNTKFLALQSTSSATAATVIPSGVTLSTVSAPAATSSGPGLTASTTVATSGDLHVSGISTFTSDVNVGGGLSVTGNSYFVGMVTFAGGTNGTIQLGDTATDNVVFNADVNSNIVPNTNNAYDLGSSSQKWRNLFISGNANIGGTLTYEDVTNIDSIGIITARSNIDCNGNLDVSGTSSFGDNITVTSTDTGSSAAPEFKLFRNSASPADADYLGQIKFAGESDTGVERNYAKITGKILDASNGTEDGIIEFAHIKNGSQTITGRWRSDSLQLLNGTNLSVNGSVTATTFSGSGASLTNLNATNLASGTIPDARFPAALPAIDGSALTGITASGTGAIGGLTIKNQSGAVVGTAGSVSTIDFDGSAGVTVTATTGAAGIATVLISADLVTDTSPQLGGNLDLNGNNITGSGNIPAANLTGTLPAISGANLTNLNGSNISSGTVSAARVGALPASKITTGTFADARIPDLAASKITSGTFDAARIPTLNQDTTGTAALAEGLTGSPTIGVSTITTTGSVGIGSTQPTGKLDVLGQVNIKGSSTTTSSGIATSYTGSVEFDGTGDYLEISSNSDLSSGTGDFTFEAWVRSDVGTQNSSQCIYDNRSGTGSNTTGFFLGRMSAHSGKVELYSAGNYRNANGTAFTEGQWNHVAVVRHSNVIKLYLNGTKSGDDYNVTDDYSNTTARIGAAVNGTSTFYGEISNARFVKGTALYKSNFTPQTAELTQVHNTTLLACQSSSSATAEATGKTITANGNAAASTTNPGLEKGFNISGSVLFDGTNDYLSVGSHSDLAMGTGDFTIEMWVYSTDSSLDVQYRRFFVTDPNGSGSIQFGHINSTAANNGRVEYATNAGSGVRVTGTTDIRNRWAHVAVVRNNNTVTLYIDGKSEGTPATDTGSKTANTVRIGKSTGSAGHFEGYMSNVRVIKGTALYTSNFSPTFTELTELPNTKFLALQSSSSATAYAVSPGAITANGGISASSTSPGLISPNSVTGSVQFDGTDDKLTTADSADYVLLQDFTFELWAYRTSDPNSYSRLAHWGDYWGNNTAVGLFFDDGDNADKVVFRTYSGISVVGTTSVSSNQWYHIAITRSGNTYRLFLDGNLEATTTSSTTIHSGSTTELCIASTHNRDTDEAFAGHISNARFVKGTALYTSAFTPPREALTNVTNTKLLCCQSSSSVTEAAVGSVTASSAPVASTTSPGLIKAYTNAGGTTTTTTTTPGNLLVSGITTATNRIDIKSDDSTPGRIDFYCESNNAHYTQLRSAAHSAYSGIATVTLPTSSGTLLLSDGDGSSLTGISADVVDDTTPQLGGTLDTNGNLIQFGDSGSSSDDRLQFGTSQDLQIYHDGNNSLLTNSTGVLLVRSDNFYVQNSTGTKNSARFYTGAQVDLRYNGSTKFETTNDGAVVTGILTATSFSGDGSNLTNISASISGINTAGISTFNHLNVSGVSTFSSTVNVKNLTGSDAIKVFGTETTEVFVHANGDRIGDFNSDSGAQSDEVFSLVQGGNAADVEVASSRLKVKRTGGNVTAAFKTFTTIVGTTYTVTCDVEGIFSSGNPRVQVTDATDGGTAYTGTQLGVGNGNTNTRTSISFTFTATSTTSSLNLGISDYTREFYVYDLSITAPLEASKITLSSNGNASVAGIATVSTAFYLPQYTTTARDAGTFNEGAMIYNTTTKKMEFYDGTNWNTLPGVTLGLGMGVF